MSQTPFCTPIHSGGGITSNVRTYALYFTRRTYGVQNDIKYEVSDKLKLDVSGAYSDARFINPQVSDTFSQSGLSYNYLQTSNGIFATPTNLANYNNLSLYPTDTHFVENYSTIARHYEAKAKLAYNMAARDFGFGMEGGASFIRNTHDESYNQTTWSGLPFSLASVASPNRICDLNCNNGGLYIIDPGLLQSQLNTYLPTAKAVYNTAAYYKDTFGVGENVTSAYLMARYRTDKWTVAGGLRLEHTDFATTGFEAQTGSTVNYLPISASNHYNNWLPSITTNYDLRSDMTVRASYSQTLGRPKFTDEGLLGGSLNITNLNDPILATGNPNLKPRLSNNFDLGYDWYFDRNAGLFSVALFYKIVKHEIYLLGQSGMVDIGGGDMVAGTITTPVNSPYLTKVGGVELNFIKYLTFLPGPLKNLGVNANAVFDGAHFPIRLQDGTLETLSSLPDQARIATNLAVFYETPRFHARVAWHHTGDMIEDRSLGTGTTSAANFYAVRWDLAANDIDASLSYNVTKRFTVRLDATNITGQGTDSNVGLNKEIPLAREKLPTAIMAGFALHL